MNKQILALTLLAVTLFATTSILLSGYQDDSNFELENGSCATVSAKSGKFFVTNKCDHNIKITLTQSNVDFDTTFTTDCLTPKQGQATTLASGKSYSITTEVAC
ncbi:hypothetical protein ABPG72_007417 [Tetrahymena utriculariae]